MKKIPHIQHSWKGIYGLAKKNLEGILLITAIQLRIFDCLDQPVSPDRVAGDLGSHPRNTLLLLNALAGMGLVHKKEGLFFNTRESRAFLSGSSPAFLGPFFCRVRDWYTRCSSTDQMKKLLMNGPRETAEKDDDLWADYTREASAHQFCGPAQRAAALIAALPEFPGMNKMLDLGGGAGFYTMLTVSAHKTMTGIVFDLPPVAGVAEEFIREYGFQDRVRARAGNYITDPIGRAYDLVYAGGTLHFAKAHLDGIFQKIHSALNPGGIFISQHGTASCERTRPGEQILDFFFDEINGMDLVFPKGMIAGAMARCGFKSIESRVEKTEYGEVDIDIARK